MEWGTPIGCSLYQLLMHLLVWSSWECPFETNWNPFWFQLTIPQMFVCSGLLKSSMRTFFNGNACIQSSFIRSHSEGKKINRCLRLVLIFTLLLSFQFEPYPTLPISFSLFDSSCLHNVSCLQLYGQSQELTINVSKLSLLFCLLSSLISMLKIVQYLLGFLYAVSLFASFVESDKRRSFDPCGFLAVFCH